jgi:homoserine dehydrogenase
MKQYRLCFIGFGNVGRALARLFVAKSAELRESFGIEWKITGVASRRIGWRVNEDGFDVAELLAAKDHVANNEAGIDEWLKKAAPDVVF